MVSCHTLKAARELQHVYHRHLYEFSRLLFDEAYGGALFQSMHAARDYWPARRRDKTYDCNDFSARYQRARHEATLLRMHHSARRSYHHITTYHTSFVISPAPHAHYHLAAQRHLADEAALSLFSRFSRSISSLRAAGLMPLASSFPFSASRTA